MILDSGIVQEGPYKGQKYQVVYFKDGQMSWAGWITVELRSTEGVVRVHAVREDFLESA